MARHELTQTEIQAQADEMAAACDAELARRAAANLEGTDSTAGTVSFDTEGNMIPGPSGPGLRRLHSDIDDDEDEEGYPGMTVDDPRAPYTLEQGRALKRHKNFSAQSDADIDMFLQTVNPQRHFYQLLSVSLECRDLLQTIKADQTKKYKLPDMLSKTCQDYASVALLSPKAKSYRNVKEGPTIASIIVGAMRLLGVADLPPPMETGRCAVLARVIAKALTDERYHIKSQIFLSLAGDLNKEDEKVNIAQLSHNCVGSSPAKVTAGMYQRMAFIRALAVEYKKAGGSTSGKPTDDSKDDFWPIVDSKLGVVAKLTAAQRQMQFDMAYRADIEKHGPVNTKLPVTEAKDLEKWLVDVAAAVSK